jgi:hypothetical protein
MVELDSIRCRQQLDHVHELGRGGIAARKWGGEVWTERDEGDTHGSTGSRIAVYVTVRTDLDQVVGADLDSRLFIYFTASGIYEALGLPTDESTRERIIERLPRNLGDDAGQLVGDARRVTLAANDGDLEQVVANGQGDNVDGYVEFGNKFVVRGGGVKIHDVQGKRTMSLFL